MSAKRDHIPSVELRVLGISFSQSMSGAYALVLEEPKSAKRIPVVIGDYEAQAIVRQLEGMVMTRPQTHDLLVNLIDSLSIEINRVTIYKLEDGVFHAMLHLHTAIGLQFELEARTSDAVALALRKNTPIYTTRQIVEAAGIPINLTEPSDAHEDLTQGKDMEHASTSELEGRLQESIMEEDYEQAARIRDEIKRRG